MKGWGKIILSVISSILYFSVILSSNHSAFISAFFFTVTNLWELCITCWVSTMITTCLLAALCFKDIHGLHSGRSEPLPAAAHLHYWACAHVHRPAAGWNAASCLLHRRQLLFQHAPQPKEPVLCHQVGFLCQFYHSYSHRCSSDSWFFNFKLHLYEL